MTKEEKLQTEVITTEQAIYCLQHIEDVDGDKCDDCPYVDVCSEKGIMEKIAQMAIKALEQEQNEPMVEIDLYSVIKQKYIERDVLDKIRAEILEEKECAYADFEKYKVDYLGVDAEYVEDELPQDDFRYGMERAIEIIDKYKAGEEE